MKRIARTLYQNTNVALKDIHSPVLLSKLKLILSELDNIMNEKENSYHSVKLEALLQFFLKTGLFLPTMYISDVDDNGQEYIYYISYPDSNSVAKIVVETIHSSVTVGIVVTL